MHFVAAQKLGATGLVQGKGVSMGWANKTFFNPNDSVPMAHFLATWSTKFPKKIKNVFKHETMTIGDALYFAAQLTKQNQIQLINSVKIKWGQWDFSNFDLERPIRRIELAALLNESNIFKLFSVNLKGDFIKASNK
jgi:hypothetical protein